MTSDVFLLDAVRTPRGRGRSGRGLHEVKPIDLVPTLLQALERRNDLDTERADDIILGVVNPIGEQGSVLPKSAALSSLGYSLAIDEAGIATVGFDLPVRSTS